LDEESKKSFIHVVKKIFCEGSIMDIKYVFIKYVTKIKYQR